MKIRTILLITCLTIIISLLNAIPAYPGLVDFQQPGGDRIPIRVMGDERIRWAENEDGKTLLFNNEGQYVFAILDGDGNLIPSEIMVKNTEHYTTTERNFIQSLHSNLFFNQNQLDMLLSLQNVRTEEMQRTFPPTGNRKLIMILIGFTDVAFTKTQTDFNNLMNQINYNTNGAFGSVKDWFLANSFDQLTLTTDVTGPYTASHNMSYYGANSGGGDVRPRELVTEAINLANPNVDFTEYDNDDDGTVDGVYVIFAGYGEEAGGSSNAIWSHAWSINPVTLDGVTISKYSCSPELSGNSGSSITNIGVICHEFSHVCGLPDFYDTDYSGSGGQSFDPGDWDPMAGGSWNDNGRRPPFHNAYSRNALGWQLTETLSTPSNITLPNSAQNNVSCRYNTQTNNEFFMVENRQQISWDYYIPYHGLIIYHVDKNWSGWQNNKINATPSHQGFDIEEADNSQNSNSTNGDPFPGTSSNTSFTDTTTPNSKSWANANTAKPITSITENNGVISFLFMGGDQTNPASFTATSISTSQINLTWQANAGYPNVMIAVNSTNTFGTPQSGTNYSAGQVIAGGGTVLATLNSSSYQYFGLTPGTTYYFKIWSVINNNSYSSGLTASATTQFPALYPPYLQDFNAGTSLPNAWTLVDNQGNGQVWEFGTVNGGLTGTGNYAYLDSDGYGSGNSQNADLISPVFDMTLFTNISLQFTHYYRHYTGSSAKLYYSVNNGQSWTLIQSWSANSTNPATFNQSFPALAGQSQVLFKWNYTGSYGYYWCVDNIQINGTTSAPVDADFTANPTLAYTGVPILFTNNSTGPVTSYAWNFGEGASPATANTVGPHTVFYNTPGQKTVTLTVNGTNTETKENYINVLPIYPPSNLSGVGGDDQVILAWQAPQTLRNNVQRTTRSLTGYRIYRNNTLLNSIDNQLTYTDLTAENGNSYNYYVTAVYENPTGESSSSNVINVTLAPDYNQPPVQLTAQMIGQEAYLNWLAPGTYENGFYLNDDFENGLSSGYTLIDANNDGLNWSLGDEINNQFLMSRAYFNGNYTNPNNWFISPRMDFATNGYLSFDVKKLNQGGNQAHLQLKLSTATNHIEDFTTVLLDLTIDSDNWTTQGVLPLVLPYTMSGYLAWVHVGENNNDVALDNIHYDVPVVNQRNFNDLIGYQVYRDNVLLTTELLPRLITHYEDPVASIGNHTYSVKAVYEDNVISAPASVQVGISNPSVITVFPYLEGFENAFPGSNWIIFNKDYIPGSWWQMTNSASAHTGSKYIESTSDNDGFYTQPDNWLISPIFTVPASNNPVSLQISWFAKTITGVSKYSFYTGTGNYTLNSLQHQGDYLLNSTEWTPQSATLQMPGSSSFFFAIVHDDSLMANILDIDDLKVEICNSNTEVNSIYQTVMQGNYPNPFNPETRLSFSLKSDDQVKLSIYNAKGQKVRTLINEKMVKGQHQVVWNGKDDQGQAVGSGVYFCKMQSGSYSTTKKMMLLK